MKILFCHNYYRFQGGEDHSFESEVAMLRGAGHEVITFTRHNDSVNDGALGLLRVSARTLHSRSAKEEMETYIREHRPDVVHCNNLFPQLSTSIYSPARAAGIPVVQSIRNYRSFCANGFFLRDEKVCTDCLGSRASFHSIRHGCYRGSRAASTVVTTMQLWQRSLDRLHPVVTVYVTPTEFSRQLHISGGFDEKRIVVKPNFIAPDPGHGPGSPDTFLFAGRLSAEKGLKAIIAAWEDLDAPLRVFGDGPMKDEIIAFAETHPAVTYLGHQPLHKIVEEMGAVRAVLMPSVWYETFGRTIAESFSRGTPVIASRLGAMAELVQDGINGTLIDPNNPEELSTAVRHLLKLEDRDYASMRESARQSFKNHYSIEENYRRLMEIYGLAIEWEKERVQSSNRIVLPSEAARTP